MEDKIGTIEPGKLADLAVLDRDYFTVPDAEISKIRSVADDRRRPGGVSGVERGIDD